MIRPLFWAEDSEAFAVWRESMEAAERHYLKLIELGARADDDRRHVLDVEARRVAEDDEEEDEEE